MMSMRIRSTKQIPPTAPPIVGPKPAEVVPPGGPVSGGVVGVGAVAAREHVAYTLKCSN